MFERSSDAIAELRGGAAPLSVLLLCFGGGLPPARHGPRPRRRHKLRRTSGDLIHVEESIFSQVGIMNSTELQMHI